MNIPWKQKLTNQQLYEILPTVSSKVFYIKMKLAGKHGNQYPEEMASKLVLWQPAAGRRSLERQLVSLIGLGSPTMITSMN